MKAQLKQVRSRRYMLIQEVTILYVFILAINDTTCIIDHQSTLEKKGFED